MGMREKLKKMKNKQPKFEKKEIRKLPILVGNDHTYWKAN